MSCAREWLLASANEAIPFFYVPLCSLASSLFTYFFARASAANIASQSCRFQSYLGSTLYIYIYTITAAKTKNKVLYFLLRLPLPSHNCRNNVSFNQGSRYTGHRAAKRHEARNKLHPEDPGLEGFGANI